MHPNMSLGPTRWIRCIPCEKFWCDFMARNFALIAPVWPILQQASCSNKTIQNAPKHYETHQNMSLGPMGWIGCVRRKKFKRNFMVRTCALIAPVQPILHRVSYSNEILPNTPKHYELHQKMSLGFNGVDRVRSLWKIQMRFHGTNLCINCTSATHFAPSFV